MIIYFVLNKYIHMYGIGRPLHNVKTINASG